MRILITGGAGFIGSHVAEAYLKAGHDVAIIDNLSTGKRENLPKGARFFGGAIQDRPFVEQVMQEFTPDVLNHHAAQISVVHSVAEPHHDAEVNILGTLTLLETLARHNPSARIIYASSGGAMYGDPAQLPYHEEATPKPSAPYGLSKHVAERYVWLYSNLYGFQSVVLRYANVYGPRQDPHGEAGVCAIFANRMHAGEPVTIFGDGSATRDYVFVGDVAEANLRALENGHGHAFNVGTGNEVSTNEVFTAFAKHFSYPHRPEHKPLRPGELQRSVLNPAKAVDGLGWRATTPFEDGVAATVHWYNTASNSKKSAPVAKKS